MHFNVCIDFSASVVALLPKSGATSRLVFLGKLLGPTCSLDSFAGPISQKWFF